jgi:antirestriction protein ArdC
MAHPAVQTNQSEPAPKRDFRQEVTDNIVALLEKGVAPWQKPWNAQVHAAMPMNPTTDKPYRGGNAVHLLTVGLQKNYDDPRWMTYKQAAEQGWQVRKGEKGTQIEFWDVKPESKTAKTRTDDAQEPKTEDQPDDHRLIHRIYTVFNARQIDGIPPYAPKEAKPFEAVEAGERILSSSGARIAHDQADRAFYSRQSDSIHLPPKDTFKDPGAYYGTALHELAHWTGHPDRLNRSTLTESYTFGDQNSAKEELRAELASVFIAAEKGIPHDPESHAAYVGSWIQALKQDKHEIFRAAHDASKATDFLLVLERDTSIADQALGAGPETSNGTSRAANLRQEAADLDRSRDQIGEQPLSGVAEPANAVVQQNDRAPEAHSEDSRLSARYEPGSSTMHVEDKHTSTDRRSNVPDPSTSADRPPAPNYAKPAAESLREAESITSRHLGQSAKTYPAQIDSGIYRGTIIGETPDLFIQRLSPKSAIAHPKELFEQPPGVGANVSVNYSKSKPLVREIRERGKAQELSR